MRNSPARSVAGRGAGLLQWQQHWDVIVNGGGPAGCLCAMLLARSGCAVAVLDKQRQGGFLIGETLPPEASRVLRDYGLLDSFLAQGHRPARGIVSVWGNSEPWARDFLFSVSGNGWHIDRAKFNALLANAAGRAGAAVSMGMIQACTRDREMYQVTACGDGYDRTLTARLIIDASGRASGGRLGLPGRQVLDRLIAVAGLARPRSSHAASDYTLIEAVDEGWFYSALLPSDDYVVAYMTDADLYSVGRHRSGEFFANQLSKAALTRERVEGLPASLSIFPANSSWRDHVAGPAWLAIGDAARSYDPLSGLGILTAMQTAGDGAVAALALLDGDAGPAQEYDQANRAAFREYSDGYQRYYSQERRWPESRFWSRRPVQGLPLQQSGSEEIYAASRHDQ